MCPDPDWNSLGGGVRALQVLLFHNETRVKTLL